VSSQGPFVNALIAITQESVRRPFSLHPKLGVGAHLFVLASPVLSAPSIERGRCRRCISVVDISSHVDNDGGIEFHHIRLSRDLRPQLEEGNS
jgi:hypothetical protein